MTTSSYSTPAAQRALAGGGSSQLLRYDNLSFYKAGVAVTAMNVTLAADYIGGRVNGQLAMAPSGGVNENAVLVGVTYANGPIVLGAEFGVIDSQGDPRLTGVSQRHEYEIGVGGTYKLAPGVQLVAEYQYEARHQGGFDFATGTLGQTVGGAVNGRTNDSRGQGLLLSTVLTW